MAHQGCESGPADRERNAIQALLADLVQLALTLCLIFLRLCWMPRRLILQPGLAMSIGCNWLFLTENESETVSRRPECNAIQALLANLEQLALTLCLVLLRLCWVPCRLILQSGLMLSPYSHSICASL